MYCCGFRRLARFLKSLKLRWHRYVKSTMNNYILCKLMNQACTLECTQACTPECTLRSKTQVDNDKAFHQRKSKGTQIEQGLSRALLYLRIAGNVCKFHGIVPSANFVRGVMRRHVGGDQKKLSVHNYPQPEKHVGRNPHNILSAKCSTLIN